MGRYVYLCDECEGILKPYSTRLTWKCKDCGKTFTDDDVLSLQKGILNEPDYDTDVNPSNWHLYEDGDFTV